MIYLWPALQMAFLKGNRWWLEFWGQRRGLDFSFSAVCALKKVGLPQTARNALIFQGILRV